MVSEPFHTSLGLRGRLTIPSSVQEEAGIGVGDKLVIRAAGPGVIIVETPQAARSRTQPVPPGDGKESNGHEGSTEAAEQ